MRTVKFYTLGCKVNQYDTQGIREQFLGAGFEELENSYPADVYVINTCTVTRHADSESFSLIRRAIRENSKARIIVTGCLTELDEDKIKKVDRESIIVRNNDKDNILNKLADNNEIPSLTNRGISYFKGHTRAFLKIQDGCDNFCSYCKVPLVRGRSRSKRLDDIVREARELIKNGFKEIVLSGICLGSYGKDLQPPLTLVDVINALENIEGLLRIRLSSIEAGDVSDELINKMAQSRKLCRHLHIPIQSGDDEILKKMDRKYCRDDYLNLIHKIKKQIPEVAITTDVMVDFPGETEINFQNTVDLIKEITPLKVHIFPYSPREGTSAFNFKDKLQPAIIKERILCLKNVADTCALTYKKQFLNKNMTVLIEGYSKKNLGFWEGYTDNYIKVKIKSNQNLKNQLIPVRLKKIIRDFILADFC